VPSCMMSLTFPEVVLTISLFSPCALAAVQDNSNNAKSNKFFFIVMIVFVVIDEL